MNLEFLHSLQHGPRSDADAISPERGTNRVEFGGSRAWSGLQPKATRHFIGGRAVARVLQWGRNASGRLVAARTGPPELVSPDTAERMVRECQAVYFPLENQS
jgi:hypothetical protein